MEKFKCGFFEAVNHDLSRQIETDMRNKLRPKKAKAGDVAKEPKPKEAVGLLEKAKRKAAGQLGKSKTKAAKPE